MGQRIPIDEVSFIPRSRARRGLDTAKVIEQMESVAEAEAAKLDAPKSRPDHLLTVAEVAERLQVPRSWVYSNADKIGALHVGKYLRFEWETVRERLRSPRGASASQPIENLRRNGHDVE